MSKRLDLEGKQYGQLMVIKFCGISERGASLWMCHCKRCGKDTVFEGAHIPEKKDCGCRYRERRMDLTGKHIGVLQVLRRAESPKSDAVYICRCDLCGKEKAFPASTIRSLPKSCGCRQYDIERLREQGIRGSEAGLVNGVSVYKVTRNTPQKNNSSGFRGVTLSRGKWRAHVQVAQERWIQDGFDTPEEAYEARTAQRAIMLQRAGITEDIIQDAQKRHGRKR